MSFAPTTAHMRIHQDQYHNEILQNELKNYVHTQIKPNLPSNCNIAHVPPSLLRPSAYLASSTSATGRPLLGSSNSEDHFGPIRRTMAAQPLSLGNYQANRLQSTTFAPPTREQLQVIAAYGHSPEYPYNSADFPPQIGTTDRRLKKNMRHAGDGDMNRMPLVDVMNANPLMWDASLDQSSSQQYRHPSENGAKFRSYLHPPMPSRFTRSPSATNASIHSSTNNNNSNSQSIDQFVPSTATSTVSLKRYHRPIKPALPQLNKATYLRYLSTTQPLLSTCIAGRQRSSMTIWRDELAKRKIDPYAKDVRK